MWTETNCIEGAEPSLVRYEGISWARFEARCTAFTFSYVVLCYHLHIPQCTWIRTPTLFGLDGGHGPAVQIGWQLYVSLIFILYFGNMGGGG